MSGIELIAKERKRQIDDEGYTSKRDDGLKDGSLAMAAACYATPRPLPPGNLKREKRIRDLVKAGALIAAEIDRLERTMSHG